MKKLFCLGLIVLSLFSCVLFSACGNKYKDLEMTFYSVEGEVIDEISFMLDDTKEKEAQRIGVEFEGIKKKDVGQVKFYSIPNELIVDLNYSYSNNMCYVDILPVMPSSTDAKLVVSHLASGKKKEIDLRIDQKSRDLNVNNSKYIISIPDGESEEKFIDFSKMISLVPFGSTDKVCFEVVSNPDNISTIPVENEALAGASLMKGFNVSNLTPESVVTIYPVTYVEGYEDTTLKEYVGKSLEIHFKKTLNSTNIDVLPKEEMGLSPEQIEELFNNLQLLANDEKLNSFKITLEHDEVSLSETDYYEMYELEVVSSDEQKVFAFVDANKDVVIEAKTHTESLVEVKIVLKPINYVGEIFRIEKSIFVKGEVKADDFQVMKNGELISNSEKTDIFDYYEEGNSLGALFNFKPVANSGVAVHHELNTMEIVVDPTIIDSANVVKPLPAGVDIGTKLYVLSFHLFSDRLMFEYDEILEKMVSQPINAESRVYIKYIDGNPAGEESTAFGIDVSTINMSEVKQWESLEPTRINLNFNRLEGVKSMALEAGTYTINHAVGSFNPVGNNPEYVYLNRLEGLDNADASVKYVNVKNQSVLGIDDMRIQKVEFNVTIEPLNDVSQALMICEGLPKQDVVGLQEGVTSFDYSYDETTDDDVVGLVFRRDTSIGDYLVTFYQEKVAKGSVICRVYEDLNGLQAENIDLETNQKAFRNVNYRDAYAPADYIVASGENLDIAVNLAQATLDSNIVAGYVFEFDVGVNGGEGFVSVANKTEYFEKVHDDTSFNNAILKFIKGTYVEGCPQYVYLTITVLTKQFDDIVTESATLNEDNKYGICFFVYEEIQDNEIAINHASMTRYFEKYLGVYYKEEATANLKIEMAEELWNYVILIDGVKKVNWIIDNGAGVTFNPNEKECDLLFNMVIGSDEYTRIVKAYVYQFENVYELQCVFKVKKPIITERVAIESEVNITDDLDQNYYINLKNGETYKVQAKNYSNLGDVTHAEIAIQVADENGSAFIAREYFDINQTDLSITVKKVDNAHKFQLIVFAKDALQYIPSSDKSGYNYPSGFLLDLDGVDRGRYLNAYFVMDIELSDGTIDNPYLIKNANEFLQIDDTETFKSAHYKLMTSISLDNATVEDKTIKDFAGSIVTNGDNIFKVDGIYLNNDCKYLFKGFLGEIENIEFEVHYSYNITDNIKTEENLGLFDVNNGKLTNVSAKVNGTVELNSNNTTYYFGGLVGNNIGEISYENTFGVQGTIILKGSSKTAFGGLVGKNVGKIIGLEQEVVHTDNDNEVKLNMASGREKTLSQIAVQSFLSGDSTIGGVVGLNTYDAENSLIGTVKNGFVQAIINAEETSNVGGVVGTNEQQSNDITLNKIGENLSSIENVLVEDFKNKSIYNIKSNSTIRAKNNVGGIVGNDVNGIYIECDFQVLIESVKKVLITGNENVGGIAGKSNNGKFAYCSVMSYWWNYANLKEEDKSNVITDVADIHGVDYVGGIVGFAISSADILNETGSFVINNRTIVFYSSVNAYLVAEKEFDGGKVGNIGGILSTDNTKNYKSVIFNAYFIGRLDGDIKYVLKTTQNGYNVQNHSLCLDNNGSSIYNAVYTLNLEDNEGVITAKLGCLKDNLLFNIEANPNLDYWWWNANINGGYIFITTDTDEANLNKVPIFDLSPESIEVTVKNPKTANLNKVLALDYYDLTLNTALNDVNLATLNNHLNRNQKVLDLLNVETKPKGLGTVVLNVKSTNTNIIDVSIDGRLIVNGVGECELIFSSVINPNVGDLKDRSVKVVVDYPFGDSLKISTSRTDLSKEVVSTQNIAKNTSKQYYVITSGNVLYDFDGDGIEEAYSYKTKENLNLQVLVKYYTADVSFKVADYVGISGQNGTETYDGGYKILTFTVDYKTPLTISVLKQIENQATKDYAFELELRPYVTIKQENIFYPAQNKQFNLSTLEGVSKISFSYDEAVVYPNDTVYLTSHIVTDDKIINVADILKLIRIKNVGDYKYDFVVDKYVITKISTNQEIGSFVVNVDEFSHYENNIQTVVFRIEFDDLILSGEAILEINAIATSGIETIVLDKVLYNIIPQRINKLEIKNFYYKNAQLESEMVLENVLKPDNAGKMQIDIVPDKGYYSYLEISDITGDEEILFIEIDENGNALTLHSDPSSDNKGIKIYNNENLNKKRIYVRTQIDRNYSSKIHTVEVRAYSNNGTLLYSQTIEIDVKMMPEITVDYLLPNGSVGQTISTKQGYNNSGNILLANGVDAKFMIVTENANSDLEYQMFAYDASGDEDKSLLAKYSFRQDVGNHYVLDRNDETPDLSDVGKTIRINFIIFSYLDNGDFNKAECYVEFEIVPFVLHSVSVSNSIDNLEKQEIYGYFDKPIKLNFYFDKHDISFYDTQTENEPFWDTVYSYEERKELDNAGTLGFIYSILRDLNAYEYNAVTTTYTILEENKYLILNDNSIVDDSYTFDVSNIKQIALKNNQLEVKYDKDEDYNPKYLAVAFKVYYDTNNNVWEIDEYNKEIADSKNAYVINKNYNLNFIHATNWYEPTVVHNEEDFLEMVSGGRYILAKDLTFDTYAPLDINLVEFDGNGRTITIKGFDKFNEEEISAGLFKQVYENMIVKNVVVKYETRSDINTNEYTFGDVDANGVQYADLCNNLTVNYTALNFGGVAAVNNGIITNCSVEGRIAVSASTIEQKKFASGGNYEINFFVGGVVAFNNETGYITNSVSNLSIFAQANVGGFAYSNNGKIVSCAVEKDTTIYGYNTNLDKTIVVRNAGFVVENSNEISMSYVNLQKGYNLFDSVYAGTMSSKDISAGFVYANAGKICDAFVQMTDTGINNNSFAGFVNQNTGTIDRAYAYTNRGTKVDNNDSTFAPAGTENLNNCVEFVIEKAGYNNGIKQGLSTINVNLRYDKTVYEQNGFIFGDNQSAVWTISSGSMAKLVSSLEKVEFVGMGDYNGLLPLYQEYDNDDDDNENKIVYRPNFAYYGTKENPYIITDLASWNEYFTKDPNGYFRIVKDIDFLQHGDNPSTSIVSFKGNIQGNNMILSNIMLYSTSNLDSLGLFKEMKGNSDPTKANAVRNLKLTSTSVWASKTMSVGLLAGIIEDFNIYNITIDAENVILVGGNAVGGLAGVVRGDFDIDYVYSNVGANSTRASTLYNYSIYNSQNNKKSVSNNLQNVYYAGSVAGILDGYNGSYDINADRLINKKYYKVRNIYVEGDITVIGDTVGGAFGLIGERVNLINCDVNISGALSGVQYSAGVVGENRGVLNNANITIADNVFDNSRNVSSGVVGLNLGGLVSNVDVSVDIFKSGYGKVVGGIIGRDIYGTVNNVKFNGQLNAFFTGVIVGTSYKDSMLTDITSGYGSLSFECKTNKANLIPNKPVKYFNGNEEVKNYENITITKETFEYVLNASQEFYTYENSKEGNDTLNAITRKTKVLGLIVGLGYESIGDDLKISVDAEGNIVINSADNTVQNQIVTGKLEEAPDVGVVLKQGQNAADVIRFVFEEVRTVYYQTELPTVIYVTGSVVSSFDSWGGSYSNDYIVFTSMAVTPL